MICKYCGSEVPDNAEYCEVCGAYMQDQVQNATQNQNPYGGQPQRPVQNQNPYTGYGQPQGNAQNPYSGQPERPVQNQNPYAGYGQPQGNAQNPYSGQPQRPVQNQNPYNGYAPQNGQQNPYMGQPQNPYGSYAANPQATRPIQYGQGQGMKWFNFIIWVQLFLSAIACVYNAILLFTGGHYNSSDYGNMSELVYNMFDGLKGVDVFFGVIYLLLASLAIFVRFRLSGFKKNGPACYYFFCAVVIVITIAYPIVVANVVRAMSFGDVMTSTYVTQIVTSVILLIINIIYFGKRKNMFVN